MAQHDGIISNDTGANVRADINNALAAVFGTHSGATEPSTTYAYQLWMDTSSNVLKMRNSANSAWYTLPISPVANNTVDINGGTIDGVTIGGSSAAAGTFTTVTSTSDSEFNGVDVGRGAGNVSTNTAVGASALDANTSGGSNVALGSDALRLNTTASGNTAVGYQAGYSNTTGTRNAYLGFQAGYLGVSATDNTFVGYACGANATGSNNSFFGVLTGYVTTGHSNTALGTECFQNNTSGNFNTATGRNALYANTTGAYNAAFGKDSLRSNTTASNNTAVGYWAGKSLTTGGYNQAIGDQTLISATSGAGNLAVGHYAGPEITTGTGNICVGQNAGRSGYGVFTPTTHNYRVVVGSSLITNAYIQVAWTVTSDARDKADVTNFTHGLDYVKQLRPVNFVWDNRSFYKDGVSDGSKKKTKVQLGFLAQEVADIEDSLGINNDCIVDREDPDLLKLTETKLIPVLVNAIKELTAKVEALEAQLNP
jgi:hypothetical protein